MIHTNELTSQSSLCIICLEELDDDIMEACDKCNINCHIQCLYSWYIKNNVELCPICLKHTNNNTSITNELFELNNNSNNSNNSNNNSNNNQIETLEINTDSIEEIFDNQRDVKMSVLLIFCMCLLLILAIVFITT